MIQNFLATGCESGLELHLPYLYVSEKSLKL